MNRKAIDVMINYEIPDKLLSIEKSKINLAKFTNRVLQIEKQLSGLHGKCIYRFNRICDRMHDLKLAEPIDCLDWTFN